MKTRREFLASTGLGLVGTAVAPDAIASARAQEPTQEPAGMPPAFGTAKPVGPEVSAHTLVEAEKLVQMELSKKDLEQAAKTWRVNMAPLCERRVGPRKMELHDGLAPWSRWDPVLPGTKAGPGRNRIVRSSSDVDPLPDLLDTAGVPTTYGAEPFRDRVPKADAAVVRKLNEAGAVLVAKLSLGALALNDIWFGGQTMNPWLLEEGASGSSAGPGAATAAGLVGFSIGSETGGSIVSPSMRCGVTGLRPTYGRVPRTGAMTLCWSLDKLGPMTRSVEDALLVLQAISGPDPGDVNSVPSKLDFDAGANVKGLRVGYFPAWMKENPATDVDRSALDTAKKIGMVPVEVNLPDWPYDSLQLILFAEGAAAFEELTVQHGVDQLKMQTFDSWPNLFRQARFLSAVDFVQADRMRRKVAQEMARIFSGVDLLLVPSLRDEMLTITNFTGHPSLTLRAGFVEVTQARSDWAPDPEHPLPKFSQARRVPHGVTLIGKLFDEGMLTRAGLALEKSFAVVKERPKGF